MAACPVVFWDVFGERGHPVRATISDMGPLLLGAAPQPERHPARRARARLQDRRRRRAAAARSEGSARDAAVRRRQRAGSSRPTTATSRRPRSARSSAACSTLEQQGGDEFFGEPMLDVDDLLQTDAGGRGVVNILAADELMRSPKLYATFLLWMLSELFERLPEVGDPDKPKLVFFFDEAHLLFTDAPTALRREDRAGRAADSIEGRRRVLRHAESARRSGDGARPARQPRAARAARVHAARSEGREDRRRDAAAESEDRHARRRSPSWRVGEALVSFLDEKGSADGRRARVDLCRRRRASVRSPPAEREAIRRRRRR